MTDSSRELLLVGSLGLDDAESAFRKAAGTLGGRIRRLPDGETGPRAMWVIWNRHVFEACPALEPDPVELAAGGRVTSAIEGVRKWSGGDQAKRGAPPPPRLRVRDGAPSDDIRFGALGHAEAAKESYAVFRRLRDAGEIPAGTRFQVALPTAAAALNAHIVPEHHHLVEETLTDRLLREVDEICAAIPAPDLALQWDVSTELGQWEGVRPAWFADIAAGVPLRLARHANRVKAGVELGIHLCYGSYGNRHWMEPKDTGACVAVFNALRPLVDRPIDWLHLPVPIDRDDDAFFAPLAELDLGPETTLFLGLIHDGDGEDGTRRRIEAASKVVENFGIATECGFGRRPPETIEALLALHARN